MSLLEERDWNQICFGGQLGRELSEGGTVELPLCDNAAQFNPKPRNLLIDYGNFLAIFSDISLMVDGIRCKKAKNVIKDE